MGRLQANFNSSKNNRISIKKQNLGGGKINAYKINDYIFSYNNLISFQTECFQGGDYYAVPADPYQIPFNVNLPIKPKQVQVKLKNVIADNIRYMGIVLTNPDNKTSFINQYDFYPSYDQNRRLTAVLGVNALVTDDAQDGLFQTGVGGLLSNDITGRPYVVTGNVGANLDCKADYYFNDYIRVDSPCNATMGISPPPCPPTPNVVSGFFDFGTSSLRMYYTKLNKLINNNYNGTWKISFWNYWDSEPDDVQNAITSGVDLIFKF